MANSIFAEPNVAGTFDRLILVPNQRQPVAVANAGRTYWYIENRTVNATLELIFNPLLDGGPGCLRIPPGDSRDSTVVPELTQVALFIAGNTAGADFTFLEVAAVQSTQS